MGDLENRYVHLSPARALVLAPAPTGGYPWLGHVLTIFYVDDGMVAAWTSAEADALVDLVAGMFSMRKLGEPQDILGIKILRDRDAGTLTNRQASKASRSLQFSALRESVVRQQ
jgi:hypothetical protein